MFIQRDTYRSLIAMADLLHKQGCTSGACRGRWTRYLVNQLRQEIIYPVSYMLSIMRTTC